MLNANNQANFEEAERHCRLASAKLSQLVNQNPDATSALEDLEDYYERQLQLRVLANNTLSEQLKEARGVTEGLRLSIRHSSLCAAALVLAYVIAAAPWRFVSALMNYWTYASVAAAAYVAARATV